jgi:hypothetical protein
LAKCSSIEGRGLVVAITLIVCDRVPAAGRLERKSHLRSDRLYDFFSQNSGTFEGNNCLVGGSARTRVNSFDARGNYRFNNGFPKLGLVRYFYISISIS